jgi:hypothetical protein
MSADGFGGDAAAVALIAAQLPTTVAFQRCCLLSQLCYEGIEKKLCERVCTLLVSSAALFKQPHTNLGLLAGLKSLCIWGATSSLTAMGVLHSMALTTLTLLRAEGCKIVFEEEPLIEVDLYMRSEVSQNTFNLAVGPPRMRYSICVRTCRWLQCQQDSVRETMWRNTTSIEQQSDPNFMLAIKAMDCLNIVLGAVFAMQLSTGEL